MTRQERRERRDLFRGLFKDFMEEEGRRPTGDEIETDYRFTGFSYRWVQRNLPSLKTIESKIEKGMYNDDV